MGDAEILAVSEDEIVLAPRFDRAPPPPAPIDLLLALPRPKILRKVLQSSASMGVKRIVLFGTYRVEKSYFASPLLAPEALREELLLGLEQGRDTIVPEVVVRRLFKPFVEDELDALLPAPVRLLAHPTERGLLDRLPLRGERATLAIGPEGGLTSYEAGVLGELGFAPFSLGARILRVDVAVPFAIGQAELWLRGAGPAC